MTDGTVLQHLLDFNGQRDLNYADREMLIEDLVCLRCFDTFFSIKILCFADLSSVPSDSDYDAGKGNHSIVAGR